MADNGNYYDYLVVCGLISKRLILKKVRGDIMFWRKVFGDVMFEKVQKSAKDRNFTISTLVRLAVETYIKG